MCECVDQKIQKDSILAMENGKRIDDLGVKMDDVAMMVTSNAEAHASVRDTLSRLAKEQTDINRVNAESDEAQSFLIRHNAKQVDKLHTDHLALHNDHKILQETVGLLVTATGVNNEKLTQVADTLEKVSNEISWWSEIKEEVTMTAKFAKRVMRPFLWIWRKTPKVPAFLLVAGTTATVWKEKIAHFLGL